MRIILLKDIPHIGKKFEVKSVADGFALNSLLPSGSAVAATEGAVKRLEMEKSADEAEHKIQEDLLLKNFKSLENMVLELNVPTNEKGHLFSGIHAREILTALKTEKHLDFPEHTIQLVKPIKELGEHMIPIATHGKRGAFKLIVKSAK